MEDRHPRLRKRRARRAQRLAGISLDRLGRGQMEPGSRRHRPRACFIDRDTSTSSCCRASIRSPAACPAARRAGAAGGRPPRDYRLRPAHWPSTASADRACRAVAGRLRRRKLALHPGLAGAPHQHPGGDGRRGVAREFARNAELTDGRSMIVLGAGINHWFNADITYRAIMTLLLACRLHRPQRRRLGALRRPGEGAAADGLVDPGRRSRLEPAAAPELRHRVVLPGHRPVALRGLRRRCTWRRRWAEACMAGKAPDRRARPGAASGLAGHLPDLRSQPTRPRRRGGGRRRCAPRPYRRTNCRPGACASPSRTPTTRRTSPGCSSSGAPTCWAARARATSTSCAISWARTSTICWPTRRPPSCGPKMSPGARRRPSASSTSWSTSIFA